METIAPRSLYERDEIGMMERLPLSSGILFGAGMLLFDLVPALAHGEAVTRALPRAMAIGGIAGALFGFLFPRLLARTVRRLQDQLYAGDPALVPEPPADYVYRLPCGWMRTPNHAVGGVLYLGPKGLRFDAHRRTPARFRATVVAEPLATLQVDAIETPLPLLGRLWGRQTVSRMRVRWNGSSADFALPQAADITRQIQERIAMLRRDSAV